MILTRTPLRISFFGGGSDMPEYYLNSTGGVLSTSINMHMYLAINKTPKRGIKVSYDKIEMVEDVEDLHHDRVKNALKHYGIGTGIEVSSFCSIPTKGTGLGSSSTYTVGLLKALDAATHNKSSRYDLAERAYFIERELCGDRLGKQDHYAAAFGGFNMIMFNSKNVEVQPVNISAKTLGGLQENLIMFFTGIRRQSNDILSNQAKNVSSKEEVAAIQSKMVEQVFTGFDLLKAENLDGFGKLMHEAWELKKQLSNNISNGDIDEMYRIALRNGALGGKILGAGGGGFLLLYVKPKNRSKLISALREYEAFDTLEFTETGTEVVYNDHTTVF